MTVEGQQLVQAILQAFQSMDAEADTVRDGYPTGLSWYGAHAKPELKRPQTEPAWSIRLAKLLSEAGLSSEAECRYPSEEMRRKKCDVVTTLTGGDRVWIELKAAWKSYWLKRGGEWIYRSYLLHPLVDRLDPKTHTVPLDMMKLDTLTEQDASSVMLVLVGFDDHSSPMQPDVDELVGLAGLNRAPWAEAGSATWDDDWRPGERVHVWIWERTVS